MINFKIKGRESRDDKKMNIRSLKEKIFNKKGSSLILAMVVIALISILSTLVLSLSLNAYRTSIQTKWADEDFYYCEDYLEQVRISVVSAVNEAIIRSYGNASAMFSTDSKEVIDEKFRTDVCTAIEGFAGDWNESDGLLNQTVKVYPKDENGVPDDSASPVGEIVISFDAEHSGGDTATDNEKFVFKDVKVEYKDGSRSSVAINAENPRRFYASICTDIVVNIPSLNYEEEKDYLGALNYIFISEDGLEFNKDHDNTVIGNSTINVTGNIYSGANLMVSDQMNVQFFSDYITVCNALENKGALTLDGDSLTASLWCKDILITNNSSSTMMNGNLFVNDDLQINGKNNYVQIMGKYYGYGDGKDYTQDVSQDASQETTPNMNSAIIVNGKGTTLDLTGISKLIINGHSFFENMNYETAESLSTIVSQSLYIVNEKYFDFNNNEVFADSRRISFDNIKASEGSSLTQLLNDGYILITGGVDVASAGLTEDVFAHGYLKDITPADSSDSFVSIGVFTESGKNYCYLYWNFVEEKGEEFIKNCIEKGLIDGFLEDFMDGGYIEIADDAEVRTNAVLFEYIVSGDSYKAEPFINTGSSDTTDSDVDFSAEKLFNTYKLYMTTLKPEEHDLFREKDVVLPDGDADQSQSDSVFSGNNSCFKFQELSNLGNLFVKIQKENDSSFKCVAINGDLTINGDGNWIAKKNSNEMNITGELGNDFEKEFSGVIFVNGNVTINGNVKIRGLVVSNGKISVSNGEYICDEEIVKNCLTYIKESEFVSQNIKALVSDNFFKSETNQTTNSSSLNAADYIKFENWTRNKDTY